MTPELTKPQAALEQLADLTKTLEKEKVQLTPEVEKYVRSHVRAVQDKLQAGKDVYESELEFIPKVKTWVLMPKEWREKHPSIEDMLKNKEIIDIWPEISKRHISVTQWQDLLHVAEAAGKEKEWIDETFQFPGGGKIKVEKDLKLNGYPEMAKLPEGLSVGGSLNLQRCTRLTELPKGLSVGGGLDLMNCTGLTGLPAGLNVGRDLDLDNCTGLTELPEGLSVGDNLFINNCTALIRIPQNISFGKGLYLRDCIGLTELPKGLKVGGDLNLSGCKGLTELPEGLSVGWNFFIYDCTGLKRLPNDLSVRGGLFISENLDEQVEQDVRRLKKEGKFEKGVSVYRKP
jgi:hypothetical protein